MKTKIKVVAVILLCLFSNKGLCQQPPQPPPTLPYGNAVVPVYFHFRNGASTGTNEVQVAYDYVCSVNKYMGRIKGIKISFFVGNVDEGTCGGNYYNAGINVYIGACTPCGSSGSGGGCTSGTTIHLDQIVSDIVFVHEMGHALDLGHPENGPISSFWVYNSCMDPLASRPQDGISDTPPNMTGNWMNIGTPANNAATFTDCQKYVAEYSIFNRTGGFSGNDNWNLYNTGDALSLSVAYIVPIESLQIHEDESFAEATFTLPANPCSGTQLPDYVDCEVHYICDGKDVYYTIHGLNGLPPTNISISTGITYIKYIYHFGNRTYSKTIYYGYIYPYVVNISRCDPTYTSSGRGMVSKNPISATVNNSNEGIFLLSENAINYNNRTYNSYELYDMAGKRVETGELTIGKSVIKIDNLSSGLYIFKAINKTGTILVKKFTKP